MLVVERRGAEERANQNSDPLKSYARQMPEHPNAEEIVSSALWSRRAR